MNLHIWKRFILTSIFAAAIVASTTTVLVKSVAGTSIMPPTYAQADNMTSDGNMTEGNMTVPGIAGGGQATPVMPPP